MHLNGGTPKCIDALINIKYFTLHIADSIIFYIFVPNSNFTDMDEKDFTLNVKLSPYAKKALLASLDLCFDYLCSLKRYSDAQLLDFAILAKLSGKFRTTFKDCPFDNSNL